MFYQTYGKGNTVLLVHGFIEEGSMWGDVAKTLAKKYRVIVPDLPGFGYAPLEMQELSMEYYAEHLNEIIKKEKLKDVIMLGHSMGGYITLYFAEKYSRLLKGFGLINSHCFEDTPEKKENRKKGVEFIAKHGTRPFVTELYNNIFHKSFKKDNQKFIDGLIEKAARYKPEAVMRANEAMMNRTGKEDVLKNAKVPVLMINGKEDESAPYPNTLKQAAYPSIADVHFFDNAKHMSIFERKEESMAIIENFINGIFTQK